MTLPASPVTLLMTALRADLAAAGLGRIPSVAGPNPPVWIVDQLTDVPAPGDRDAPERDDHTVIGLVPSGEIPPAPFFGQLRQVVVDVWIRTKGKTADGGPAQRAFALENAIRDRYLQDGRHMNFTLATGTADEFRVAQIRAWTPLAPLAAAPGEPSSGEAGHLYRVGYVFDVYA